MTGLMVSAAPCDPHLVVTAYIRRGGGKKREQLEAAQAALKRAVATPDDRPSLDKAAQKLRDAHLHDIKARLHEISDPTAPNSRERVARLREEQRQWRGRTTDEIIALHSPEARTPGDTPSPLHLDIALDDGMTVNGVRVTNLGGDRYRIDDFPDPMIDAFNHRDVVRLERQRDESYDLIGVETESGWRRYQLIVGRPDVSQSVLEPIFQKAASLGGAAVLDFGGCLQVFLPANCRWNPTSLLAKLTE